MMIEIVENVKPGLIEHSREPFPEFSGQVVWVTLCVGFQFDLVDSGSGSPAVRSPSSIVWNYGVFNLILLVSGLVVGGQYSWSGGLVFWDLRHW